MTRLAPEIGRRINGLKCLVGNTPLLAIDFTIRGQHRVLYAKAEHLNMTGSIKDRMALYITEQGYARGELRPGDRIVEATSGNTGIAIAAVGRAMGHPVTIFMPEWMSRERINLIRGLGADFVRGTPAQARYAAAQGAALAALDRYTGFVRDSLPGLAEFDWRMGRAMFDTKWRYYLQASMSPEEMLRAAEDSMRAVRAEMLRLAQPLHDQWFSGHRHAGADSAAALNAVVGEVLARIGQDHTNRDSMVAQGQKDVAELERFVTDHRVVSYQRHKEMIHASRERQLRA